MVVTRGFGGKVEQERVRDAWHGAWHAARSWLSRDDDDDDSDESPARERQMRGRLGVGEEAEGLLLHHPHPASPGLTADGLIDDLGQDRSTGRF